MSRNILPFFCFLVCAQIFGFSLAQAFVPKPQVEAQWLNKKGATQGGSTGSLLTLRNLVLKLEDSKELLSLQLGDRLGKEWKGAPGYFHVELRDQPPRLIITLNRTIDPGMTPTELAKTVQASKWIRSIHGDFDRLTQNWVLDMELSQPAKVMARTQQGGERGPSMLLIELQRSDARP